MSDYLQFEGGVGNGRCEWTGEWPPPQSIWAARGNLTRQVVYIEPEDCDSEALDQLPQVASITRYQQVSASQLPGGMEFVARGALYRPEAP